MSIAKGMVYESVVTSTENVRKVIKPVLCKGAKPFGLSPRVIVVSPKIFATHRRDLANRHPGVGTTAIEQVA
jgi:hypothetical protein